MKRTKLIAVSLALVGVLAVGGISAYFTDHEHTPNVFTVGNGVDIELDEPNWDPTDPEHDEITPNKLFSKDPVVTNRGSIGAYTFIQVSVPYEHLSTTNDDGTVNEAVDTELFTYEVNDGWTQVGTPTKNTTDKTVVYTYVYGSATECTELAGGQTTPSLFDTVRFADVVEGTINGKTLVVDVNAYAIQTADIDGGTTAPVDVWAVLYNQLHSAG